MHKLSVRWHKDLVRWLNPGAKNYVQSLSVHRAWIVHLDTGCKGLMCGGWLVHELWFEDVRWLGGGLAVACGGIP